MKYPYLSLILSFVMLNVPQLSHAIKVNDRDLEDLCDISGRYITCTSKNHDVSMEMNNGNILVDTVNITSASVSPIVKFYQDNKNTQPSFSAQSIHFSFGNQEHTGTLIEARESIELQGKQHQVKQSIFKAGTQIALIGDHFDIDIALLKAN